MNNKTYEAFVIINDGDPCTNPRDDYENLGTMFTWHRNYFLGGKDDLNNQSQPDDWYIFAMDQFNIPGIDKFYDHYGTLYVGDGYEVEAGSQPRKYFESTIDAWVKENLCILNLYVYDHPGISINTSGFNYSWDSGQIGFIWCTREKAEAGGVDWANIEKYLIGEIKTLDQYFTDDVWGFRCYEIPAEELENLDWEDWDILEDTPEYKAFLLKEDEENAVEHLVETDSCWGFYGHEYLKQECKSMAHYRAERLAGDAAKVREQHRRLMFCRSLP